MTGDITNADLRGLRIPALKRIYAAARAAVVATGATTADRFDAHVRAFIGNDKPRDLAIGALGQVERIGSRVHHPNPSPQTLTEGGFLGGEFRFQYGDGPALARAIIAAERA